MDPKQLRRLAALIGAGALATGGVAIAATVPPPPDLPEEARVDEHVGSDTHDEADDEADVEAHDRDDVASDVDGALADVDTGADGEAHTEVATDPDTNDHGQAVSTFAQETGLEGRERGEAIAELASSNRQDGEHTAPDGIEEAGPNNTGEGASADRDRGDR